MPDLSQFPTYISIPLLVVFALLVLASRFLDLTEKWDNWITRRKARQNTAENSVSIEPSQPVTNKDKVHTSKTSIANHHYPLNTILSYAFLGGIAIPSVYFVFLYFSTTHPALAQQQVTIILTAMVYAALASLLVNYLSHRYQIILYHRMTIMIAGFVVSSVLAMPFNIVMSMYAYMRAGI